MLNSLGLWRDLRAKRLGQRAHIVKQKGHRRVTSGRRNSYGVLTSRRLDYSAVSRHSCGRSAWRQTTERFARSALGCRALPHYAPPRDHSGNRNLALERSTVGRIKVTPILIEAAALESAEPPSFRRSHRRFWIGRVRCVFRPRKLRMDSSRSGLAVQGLDSGAVDGCPEFPFCTKAVRRRTSRQSCAYIQ